MDTTDIEKKSLEAHVELCAERYKFLETKLESVEQKCEELVVAISSVKTTVETMATKSNDRLISWGVGIIGTLIATCAWLLAQYIK